MTTRADTTRVTLRSIVSYVTGDIELEIGMLYLYTIAAKEENSVMLCYHARKCCLQIESVNPNALATS